MVGIRGRRGEWAKTEVFGHVSGVSVMGWRALQLSRRWRQHSFRTRMRLVRFARNSVEPLNQSSPISPRAATMTTAVNRDSSTALRFLVWMTTALNRPLTRRKATLSRPLRSAKAVALSGIVTPVETETAPSRRPV